MHEKFELNWLGSITLAFLAAFVGVGLFNAGKPETAQLNHEYVTLTYGLLSMVVGGFLRALGVNGKPEPPGNGIAPKLPGT